MERQDYITLAKEGVKVYKNNEDIKSRFSVLLGLLERYPKGWFVADGYRIYGLMELMYDANKVHESMEKNEKKRTDEVRGFYASFLAKFDAEMRRLEASYASNSGAQQFKEENTPKSSNKEVKKN